MGENPLKQQGALDFSPKRCYDTAKQKLKVSTEKGRIQFVY